MSEIILAISPIFRLTWKVEKIAKQQIFKQMKTLFISLLFLGAPLFADISSGFPPDPHETTGGKRAPTFSEANAKSVYWVTLIDQQQYGASWLEAGGLVHDTTSQDQWAAAMRETRLGFGTVNSRKVSSHQMASTLPGGTRGNFIIIKYETNFSKKPYQIETVTLMTEGRLNLWKVVSYQVGKR